MTVPIARVDVPLPVLALQLAAAHTKSPSDRLAYALDEWLIGHPKAPVSTDLDYPEWAAQLAALPTYFCTKETP